MKKRMPFIFLIAIGIVFIFSFYGKVILHPDSYLFSTSGDGIKNYFTYAFHIKHDASYINFEGMNYPYGEHFLYTDCHPVFANFFKLLATNFDFFNAHSIGILSFILIFSIFLTFIICYFLLKQFDINNWLSVLFSFGITLLAPQLFRLSGHLALSYSIAIPLSWLLLIKLFKHENNTKYTLLLFISNVFWLFIHAYLGVIVIFFLACLLIAKYWVDKKRREKTFYYLTNSLAIFIPLILFYVFTLLTDTHSGRTDNPSGFFLYNAELDDVFLPHHPPLRPLLDVLTADAIKLKWEAWTYVGIATTILFIVLIVLSIMKLFKRNSTPLFNSFFNSSILNMSLIAATVVLLFAMAIPFRQIPSLLDLMPFLKQFRSTGRFAWPFYFVALVFVATVMQKIYLHAIDSRKKIIALFCCIAVGTANIMEGLPYHTDVSNSIVQSKNLFKKEFLSPSYLAAIESINSTSYQAIITLPFYYHGSENFSRPRNDESVRASMVVSYHTGLPIVCANLTRTSIKESKNIVEMISPNYYQKNILSDLSSDKPFLVIRTKDSITNYEAEIFKKCKPLYISKEISIYTLTKNDLFKSSAQTVYDNYELNKTTLFKRDSFYVSNNSSFFYYNGFETLKSDKPFRGKGGFKAIKKGQNTFAEFAPNTFLPGKKYHVSMWMFNGSKDALNGWLRFIIEEYDEDTNSWLSTTYFPEESQVINGNWSLVEGTFEVKNQKNKVFITTKGNDDSKGPLFADDLLIKEAGLDVYSLNETKTKLFFNNHAILLK